MADLTRTPDAATDTEFKAGDRIRYVNFDSDDPGGVVTEVTPHGYRIKWDDGYRDRVGPQGCYHDHELLHEEAETDG